MITQAHQVDCVGHTGVCDYASKLGRLSGTHGHVKSHGRVAHFLEIFI